MWLYEQNIIFCVSCHVFYVHHNVHTAENVCSPIYIALSVILQQISALGYGAFFILEKTKVYATDRRTMLYWIQ